ncbi:hypothetical protein D2T31_12135 [Sinirhodobacter populi]|uniref:Tape measure protein N-terminal domain-containing protein n=1 Tax=Paenirhodobacter populi TaxID=2306993 RepID=A0A443K7W1_9RHOB|nr:tape measure protein [Sinirhodobacter populi]RWR28854.1 hypothetical protein D2T31_12135 [Sinirhodobacter populi]
MATDLEKLVVQLSADIKQYQREMQKAQGVSDRQARAIENRFRKMNKNLDGIMSAGARAVITPLAGISAALSIREVARYADAWTVANNMLASASSISGTQARSLEDLNKIANETRSGISETADLYAKLLRSTAGVAKSEEDVARATEIVNKAFKAGGAAASEQAAGILQLSQGLGSGVLQGDELRSVRENAPILAQAIADYYKVSIAGLKKLGEEGKITSDGVFKAILAAQPKIEAAFATTNATIADGMTKVNNAFTEYVGGTDSSLGATVRLTQGLNALADNFDEIADVTIKVASIIAAGLLGRSIGGMVKNLGLAGSAAVKFVAAIRAATTVAGVGTALMGLSAAAAPIGAVLGVAAVGALVAYSSASKGAEKSTSLVNSEMQRLGLISPQAAKAVDQVSTAIKDIPADEKAKMLAALNDEIERLKNGGSVVGSVFAALSGGGDPDADTLAGIGNRAQYGQVAGGRKMYGFTSGDKDALKAIEQMVDQFRNMQISADDVSAKVAELAQTDLSKPAKELLAVLGQVAQKTEAAMSLRLANDDLTDIDNARAKIEGLRGELTVTKLAFDGWSMPLVKEVGSIIDAFDDGQVSAADTKTALEKVADANPQASAYIAKVTPILSILQAIIDKAALAKLSMQIGSGGYEPDLGRFPNPYADYEKQYRTDAYIKEQQRIQGLTKDQLALEKEIEQVRKAAAKEGISLSEGQIKTIAEGNIAADKARSEEGKKPKTSAEQRAVERYDDSTLKEIEGMKAETAALNALEVGQDKYGNSVARARKEAELLQQLQNKGVPITDAMRKQVAALADQWYEAAEANSVALEKHEEFQQAVETAKSSMQDAFAGLITGANSFNDALASVLSSLAQMAANKAFESIWTAGLGSGTESFLKGLGFAGGGYTGAGGKLQPAGVVHKGEYVFSKEATSRIGVDTLEAMHHAAKRGYADGGLVGAANAKLSTQTQGNAASPRITINNNAPGVDVAAKSISREEVVILVNQRISDNNRAVSDRQYLTGGR